MSEEKEIQLNRWWDCATWTQWLPTDAAALWARMPGMNNWPVSFIDFPWKQQWRGNSWRLSWIVFFNPNPEKAQPLYGQQIHWVEHLSLLELNVWLKKIINSLKSKLEHQDWRNFLLCGAIILSFLLCSFYVMQRSPASHITHTSGGIADEYDNIWTTWVSRGSGPAGVR